MRLVSVTIDGMRGIERERIALAPVTLFTGRNGTGKTAAVGAVVYALTGRFPGLMAVHPGELLALANDRRRGFRVEIETDDQTMVERGVDVTVDTATGAEKPEQRFVVRRLGNVSKNKAADSVLRTAFGDVSWFVEAFDPERSIWRISGEKRKEWALNLCAGSSGWSRDRLLEEIGPKSEDWDPSLGRDAGTCLEQNLDNLHARLLSLQQLVREANTVAEGVTVFEDVGTITQRVNKLDTEHEKSRQELQQKERTLGDARASQHTIDHTRRERTRLTKAAADGRAELAKLLPPSPPVPPAGGLAAIEAQDSVCFALDVALADSESATVLAHAEIAAALEELTSVERSIAQAKAGGTCDLCGTGDPSIAAMQGRLERAQNRLRAAGVGHERMASEMGTLTARSAQAATELQALRVDWQLYEAAQQGYEQRRTDFETTWQTVSRNVQSREDELGRLPADRNDVDTAEIERQIQVLQELVSRQKADLAKVRAELGVAQERAGQKKAAEGATGRVVEVKALLTKVRQVRDRMLDDATRPLSDALDQLGDLAPHNGRWTLHRKDKTIDVCLASARNRSLAEVPVTALSAGERMRGTIALLVARSMVRREPCALLFVDNFEQIHPAEERVDVLRALIRVTRSGFVDSVLIAGAFDELPFDHDLTHFAKTDLVMYERSRDEPPARTGT